MGKINVRHRVHTVPMLRYAMLLIVGILAGDAFWRAVQAGGWLMMTGVFTLGALLTCRKYERTSSMMILCAVVTVGGFRICYNQMGIYEIGKEGEDFGRRGVGCRMMVVSDPVERGKVLQFDGIVYEADMKEVSGTKMRIAMLRDTITGKYRSVRLGDALKASVDLSGLKDWHRINLHFDYVRWLRSRNFSYRAFVPIGKWEKTEVGWMEVGIGNMLQTKVLMLRKQIMDRMKGDLSDDAYSIATAMALGNKAALTPEMREEYSISGASHVLALSGMHLSIIYMLLTLIAGRKTMRKRLAMLFFVWSYVLFAGMPISMVRAGMMLTLWELIDMMEGNQRPMNIIGMTAFVMLMVNPQCLWDVGFEMSFMAVTSIIVFSDLADRWMPKALKIGSKKNEKRLNKREKAGRWTLRMLWKAVAVSISAQVGTMPLTAYYFGRVPLYFLLSNMMVVVFSGAIVGLSLIVALIGMFDIAMGIEGGMSSYIIGMMLTRVVEIFNAGIVAISRLPGASIEGVEINGVQLATLYGVVLVLALWANKERKKI